MLVLWAPVLGTASQRLFFHLPARLDASWVLGLPFISFGVLRVPAPCSYPPWACLGKLSSLDYFSLDYFSLSLFFLNFCNATVQTLCSEGQFSVPCDIFLLAFKWQRWFRCGEGADECYNFHVMIASVAEGFFFICLFVCLFLLCHVTRCKIWDRFVLQQSVGEYSLGHFLGLFCQAGDLCWKMFCCSHTLECLACCKFESLENELKGVSSVSA